MFTFSSPCSVTLGGVSATYTALSGNNTAVVVVANSGNSGVQGSVVLTADSGAVVTSAQNFTFITAGNVSVAAPSSGQNGTRVSIQGSGLLGGGSSIVSVRLAGVSVQRIVSSTDSEVIVVAGASFSATTGVIELVANSGAQVTSVAGAWSYIGAATVSSVTPSQGQFGTVVTIAGNNLLGGAPNSGVSISLAGVAVYNVSSVSDSQIVVVAAAGPAGNGDVVILTSTVHFHSQQLRNCCE